MLIPCVKPIFTGTIPHAIIEPKMFFPALMLALKADQ